jgi:pyruvate dehydrogenase (quinone)
MAKSMPSGVTTADLLVDTLCNWGVELVFGMPGDGINGIMEALRKRQDDVAFIQVRHEEAAAFAACAYAKLTGKPGVCLATSGPGGIHLLNGLYDAKLDSHPVLAITGHTYHDLIGTQQQQDVNLTELFRDVSVYSERVTGPAHVRHVVDQALRMAHARRGVAHINIPRDTQDMALADDERSKRNVAHHETTLFTAPVMLPSPHDLQSAANLLNAGKKVALLVGQGALGARAEVEQVAELLGAPVIKALLGKGVIADDHPLTTGGIGLLGTKPSASAMKGCDTLLIVGSTFPYNAYYPEPGQARGVQIDLDPARIGLRYPVEVGLPGDARTTLQALLPLLEMKSDRRFLRQAQEAKVEWESWQEELGMDGASPLNPQRVAYELASFLAHDAIVATDSGTITTWIARQWKLHADQRFLVSGMLASMACGLPYAIAAQLAYPERQVVTFIGDGGLSMLIGELATCVKYNLPIKIIVIKNGELGMIKWEQIFLEGNPQYEIELQSIDFAKVAEGFGIAGFRVEEPDAVRSTLRQAFAHPGPALVEAVVDPNVGPIPGMITRSQATNFLKSMAKGQPDRAGIIATMGEEYLRQVV